MNIETLIKELEKLNINLNSKQINQLIKYKEMLQEYNQKFNLTALITDEDIYLKHFYDSLTLAKAFNFDQELKLLDLGTGAGFPGLVLKIAFPKLNITLLDSNNKKIEFLKTVINTLELTNINCLNKRIEDLPTSYKETYDIITSRAVATLPVLLELAIPYLRINGYFLPMKSNIKEELSLSKNALNILNSKVETLIEFNLPLENSYRTIIKIKKEAQTSSKYPRPYNQIIKKTL